MLLNTYEPWKFAFSQETGNIKENSFINCLDLTMSLMSYKKNQNTNKEEKKDTKKDEQPKIFINES